MKICFKPAWMVLSMLKNGIETEHFTAKVIWPFGFDGEPKVSVSMKPDVFEADNFNEADAVMKETLSDELRDLSDGVHDLILEIGIFSSDRDMVRKNHNPNLCGKSCYSNVYEKKCKGECA